MSFGWLECVVVVCALPLALEQGFGRLKQMDFSGALCDSVFCSLTDPDFALGVIKRGYVHATAQRYQKAAFSAAIRAIRAAQKLVRGKLRDLLLGKNHD